MRVPVAALVSCLAACPLATRVAAQAPGYEQHAPDARTLTSSTLRAPRGGGGSAAAKVAAWRRRLDAIDEAARSGDWQAVGKRAQGLLETLREEIAGGDGEGNWYAAVATYIALSHAGLGDRREAAWWWWTAQQASPDTARTAHLDLAPYGDVGLAVRDLGGPGVREASSASAPVTVSKDGEAEPVQLSPDVMEALDPPSLENRVAPSYPRAPLWAGRTGEVVIQAVIDVDGTLRDPVVMKAASPALDVAVLDAVRQWRYRPARWKETGEPQAVYLVVRMKFNLPKGH